MDSMHHHHHVRVKGQAVSTVTTQAPRGQYPVDILQISVYEVQDPEPDENGAPGQVYKANTTALIAIPAADAPLPEHTIGKSVLARYPETTTFYRAEVTKITKDTCKLKFEDDQNQELEVDRRYVLDFNQK